MGENNFNPCGRGGPILFSVSLPTAYRRPYKARDLLSPSARGEKCLGGNGSGWGVRGAKPPVCRRQESPSRINGKEIKAEPEEMLKVILSEGESIKKGERPC
jgi:hypothetical protein